MFAPKSSFLFAVLLGAVACSVDVGGPVPAELSHYDPGVVTDPTLREAETPPPPKAEADLNPPPTPRHVWIGGYWTKRGTSWIWVEGQWVLRSGTEWVPDGWQCRPGGAAWVAGHWRDE